VSSAQAIVEGEVRELVRRRSLDPVLEPAVARLLVDDVIADYLDRAAVSVLPPLADPADTARAVFDQVAGFGPLQQYLDDRSVEEIWIYDRLTGCYALRTALGRSQTIRLGPSSSHPRSAQAVCQVLAGRYEIVAGARPTSSQSSSTITSRALRVGESTPVHVR
jgi:hypothetical protein